MSKRMTKQEREIMDDLVLESVARLCRQRQGVSVRTTVVQNDFAPERAGQVARSLMRLARAGRVERRVRYSAHWTPKESN